MLRAILSIIIGYVTIAVLVFAGLTAAWFVMGPDKAFEPDSFVTSNTWIIVIIAVGFAAALIGGIVATKIARSGGPPKILALLVLVLGLAMAVPVFMGEPPPAEIRGLDVPMFEAWGKAQEHQPKISAALNPVVGAIGVLAGIGIAGTKKRE